MQNIKSHRTNPIPESDSVPTRVITEPRGPNFDSYPDSYGQPTMQFMATRRASNVNDSL